MDKLAYSIPEAATAIGVSKSYMYTLIKEGKIPYIKIGGRKIVPKLSLEQWIQENTCK